MGTLSGVFDSKDSFILFPMLLSILTILIALLTWYILRRQIKFKYIEMARPNKDLPEVPDIRNTILNLLKEHEDVDLRLLCELYESQTHQYYYRHSGEQAILFILRDIQSDLRKILHDCIKDKEKYNLKTKILLLIDQAESKASEVLRKKPFDDLRDPEKSLLIDIFEVLPKDKEIPKQKMQQLADIIKNKYENIMKLQIENKKSAVWSRWGAIGTIVFGLFSLVLSIYSALK